MPTGVGEGLLLLIGSQNDFYYFNCDHKLMALLATETSAMQKFRQLASKNQ